MLVWNVRGYKKGNKDLDEEEKENDDRTGSGEGLSISAGRFACREGMARRGCHGKEGSPPRCRLDLVVRNTTTRTAPTIQLPFPQGVVALHLG